jgi:opacity protein-like surface antigen
MKKCLIASCSVLVVSFMLMASTAWSQDVSPSIGAGSKAALFTFSGLATLGAGSYDGGVGFKYYFIDVLALRASLQYSGVNLVIPANAPAGSSGNDGSTFGTRFGFSVAGEYHLLQTRVSPYVGAGLGLAYTYTENKTPVSAPAGTPLPDPVITRNRIGGEFGAAYVGGTNFNIAVLGGVEFFIIKELSLSAEYRFGVGLNAPTDQEVVTGPTTTKTKSGMLTQFGITSVGALAMAFYF